MKLLSFENFLKDLIIEYDKETDQYYVINDQTPWVYGIWENVEDALNEYFSALKDYVLTYYLDVNYGKKIKADK